MSAARVIETVDVFKDGDFNIPAGLPCVPPDQFGLALHDSRMRAFDESDGFEEGFHGRIIIAISLAAHGYFEAILAQDFLIVMRTILTAAI